MQKWNDAELEVAVERYNALAAGMEKTVPLVCRAINNARITAAGVDKKTLGIIAAIIKANMPNATWARVYLSTQYTYTVYLHVDFNAPKGDRGCEYADMSVAVAEKADGHWKAINPDMPKPLDYSEVKSRIDAAIEAQETAFRATQAASTARGKAFPFVKTH